MVKNLRIALAIVVFLLVTASLTFVAPVQVSSTSTHPGPYFKVEPENITYGPAPAINQTFTVSLKVYNVTVSNMPEGLRGVEVHFHWNRTQIQAISFVNKIGVSGGVLNPSVIYGINPQFYNTSDPSRTVVPAAQAEYYLVAGASLGDIWFGNGTVAEITFKVAYQPQQEPFAISLLECEYTELVDGAAATIPSEAENGNYKIFSLAPAFGISPTAFNASHVGQTFRVNITIADLLVGWNLGGYRCFLNFSKNVLQISSVSEGSFLGGFGDTEFESIINNTAGYVWLNSTQVATGRTVPQGDGVLASITFNATVRPPAKSDLLLTKVQPFMWQHPEEIIPTQSIAGGKYEMFEIISHTITHEGNNFTVQTRSNSLVSTSITFNPEYKSLIFNITGDTGTGGYCETAIPKTLLKADETNAWQVSVGETQNSFTVLQQNDTHTILAFNYNHSTKVVKIVGTWAFAQPGPMLADWMIIAIVIVIIVVVLVAIWYMLKRKKSQN
jgi:hypothetical protein